MPALAPITITGLAAKTGIDVDSIREYERLGFISRPRRGPGGFWLYRGEDVDVLVFVSRARRLGFSLEAIGELIELAGQRSGQTCQQVYEMAVRQLTEIRSRIGELTRMEQALSELAADCPQAGPAVRCPIIASLSNPTS